MTDTSENTTEIGSNELCARSGLTYRQLDYWIRNGVIPYPEGAGGSGSRRTFDVAIVPRLTVLGKVAAAFRSPDVGQLAIATYADIYNNYERGYVEMAPGVRITWTT